MALNAPYIALAIGCAAVITFALRARTLGGRTSAYEPPFLGLFTERLRPVA